MYTDNLRMSSVNKIQNVTVKEIIDTLTSQFQFVGPCALVSAAYVQYFLARLNMQLDLLLTINCVLQDTTILGIACI